MKKVLVILNGIHISNYIIPAALNLAKNTTSLLHVIFLNQDPHKLEYRYFFPNDLSLTQNSFTGKSLEEEDNKIIESNIKFFEDECRLANVQFSVDDKQDYALSELINYSEFFDLILIDANVNLYEYLLSDLLADAHCPVLLTTSDMSNIDRITLAYDGSYSSMYALKMFTYLFPEWNDKPVELIYIATKQTKDFPHEKEIKSWVGLHYKKSEIQVMTGDIQQTLLAYVKSSPEKNFLVMGAFGRSGISRMFHKSLSHAVLNQTSASVFITHK